MNFAVARRYAVVPVVVAVFLFAMLAMATSAFGAGISLDRSPTPPQAIAPGQGVQNLSYEITFRTLPERYTLSITNAAGVQVFNRTESVVGAASPISGAATWTPPPGAAPGRYTAALQFFSSVGLESTATVIFDVSDRLGTLRLTKFEDLNGNGVHDQGEPLVPNWRFRLTNPQGNASVATTGPGGTVALNGVPAGVWQVEEILQSGWTATTGTTTTVTVPENGEGSAIIGNVRPAPLSGTTWIDTNGNGVIDAGEQVRANVTLTLTGTTGLGQAVRASTQSGSDGTYVFPDLMPGSYNVVVTVPSGLTPTTARTRPNRVITSGVGNPNNDFGMRAAPTTQIQGGPRPNLAIVKRGPAWVNRGQVFNYTIRVTNRSNVVARNVVIRDPIPIHLSLVRVPSRARVANGVVTWRLGNLPARASRSVTMRVRVNPTTSARVIRNTAIVTATGVPARRSTATSRLRAPRKAPVRRAGGVTG